MAERTSDGQGAISLEAIDEPAPADAQAEARGFHVVVAHELPSTLDDAVLDAKPTEGNGVLHPCPVGERMLNRRSGEV